MASVTFDASSLCNSGTGYIASVSSVSWSHTVGSQSNLALIVAVATDTNPTAPTVSGITYNGVSLTKSGQIAGKANGTVGEDNAELWYLVGPATGSHTVAVTLSGTATDLFACAMSFYNVSQVSPIGASGTTNNSNNNANPMSISISTTSTDQITIDSIASNNSTLTAGSGQTQINSHLGSRIRAAASYKTSTASSTTMSWTPGSSDNYCQAALSLASAKARSLIIDGYGGVFS